MLDLTIVMLEFIGVFSSSNIMSSPCPITTPSRQCSHVKVGLM